MKIKFEHTVLNTSIKISVAKAFLEAFRNGLPHAKDHQLKILKDTAENDEYDQELLSTDLQGIENDYEEEIPKMFTYAFIPLLHSLVETRLIALARDFQRKNNFPIDVNDLDGPPIKRSKKYLKKVADIEIGREPNWATLTDLQTLRNIVVHRGGGIGLDDEQKKRVKQLSEKYKREIQIKESKILDDLGGEVIISENLCEKFLNEIQEFFTRLYNKLGLKSVEIAQADSPKNQ